MSISPSGVSLEKNTQTTWLTRRLLKFWQSILTLFLTIIFAATYVFPRQVMGATGISSILSYQGRLTDSSGNPLGGGGTNYCFRFSIYSDATVGAPDTKLWPAGTPSTMTISVANGVFNTGIGDTGAGGDDLSSFSFYQNDASYLNIETAAQVSGSCTGVTFENLGPRQRINAVGFARSAYDVYGGSVQVGTGAGSGAGSQKLLSLDIVNVSETIGGSCSTNGALWYNSNKTRGLICENSVIREIGGVSTLRAGGGADLTYGTVVFTGLNNITITHTAGTGTQAHTIGISAGGADLTMSNLQWPPGMQMSTIGAYSNATLSFIPFQIENYLSASEAVLLASHSIGTNTSGTTTGTWSMSVGLYSRNASSLSLITSGSQSFSISNTSNASTSVYVGLRKFSIPVNINASPGQYWYAVWIRSSGNAQSLSIVHNPAITNQYSGNFGAATNSSWVLYPGLGIFSNASITTAMPSSVALSNINGGSAAGLSREPWILFNNFDIN